MGLPNVGKSTIFNALSGKKHALVSPQAGLTRNLRSAIIENKYELIDAPGISYDNDMFTLCSKKVMQAAELSDLILYVVHNDLSLLDTIRKLNKNVIIVLRENIDIHFEFQTISLSEDDYYDLHHMILQYSSTECAPEYTNIKIAFIGMMNSGKSFLINQIIGEDKLLVYDKRGVTTDSVRVNYKDVTFIDTAGIQYTDKLILNDMQSAIDMSHIVAYIVDATEGFTKHDQRICSKIFSEGRGIMIIINKCNLSKFRLNAFNNLPILHVYNNYHEIYFKLKELYYKWNIQIKTHDLNKVLTDLTLPRTVRIKYANQKKTRPPHFNLHGTFKNVTPSITAQVCNRIRNAFDLQGIPIRLSCIQKRNPYVDDEI